MPYPLFTPWYWSSQGCCSWGLYSVYQIRLGRESKGREETYPDTPATFSNFLMSVGGRTISLSIADSIVIGCPSSSISSTSYMFSFTTTDRSQLRTYHIYDIEIILQCRFGDIAQVVLQSLEERFEE